MPNYFYSIMMWQVWGKKKRYKPFRGSVIRICTGGWAKIKSGLESFYMDLQCHAPVDLLSPEQKTDLHLQWPLQCQEKLIKNITSWAYVVVRFRFAGVLTQIFVTVCILDQLQGNHRTYLSPLQPWLTPSVSSTSNQEMYHYKTRGVSHRKPETGSNLS